MKLASFDIFDTVLIRKCGLPKNIFYLLAERRYVGNRVMCDEFFDWRCRAEADAKKLNPKKELTLNDIYVGKDGAEIEQQVESENLIVNPAVKRLIEAKRDEGYIICFISDMYLPSAFLAEILRREGCLIGDEQVFVSCEHNARKSTGALYDLVRNVYFPSEWIHYGDNYHSDVKMAKKSSINATQLVYDFTEKERLLINLSRSDKLNYGLSILAGLERAARICFGNSSTSELAADFIAPAYIAYVTWLLEDAKNAGIKRLYFLSRDSYILMKIAQIHQANYQDIEIRYLFVSRKSLLLPYLNDVDIDSCLLVQDNNTLQRKNVDSLLKGFGTSREELSEYGVTFEYDKIFGQREESDFLEKIFGEKSKFRSVLKERIVERRNLIVDYFKQEGLFEDVKSAMVDVGWLGTSRLMINSILQTEGVGQVAFYYYGIRGDVYPPKYGEFTSYHSAGELSTELTALIENYFSASPYPSTIGYQRNGNLLEPIFAKGELYNDTEITSINSDVSRWILSEIGKMNLDISEISRKWARVSLDAIGTLSVKINLSSLTKSNNFDGIAFARKLSLTELLKLVCLGAHITAFDRASIEFTCGRFCYPLLWKLHNITGKIRRKLYLTLVK